MRHGSHIWRCASAPIDASGLAPASSRTRSACRVVAVLAITPFSWVRTVSREMAFLSEISSIDSLDANWKVLLHNDDVHTFEYCTGAICSVVRTIKRKKAHTITVQAHSMGTAVVTQTYKQKAKEFCLGLQKYGLTSSISPE